MVSFVLLARALGPGDFSRYAACLALLWALMPFATLGRPHLIVMEVARAPNSLRSQWGEALMAVLVGGSVTTVALLALRPFLLPTVTMEVALSLAIAELFFSASAEVSSSAPQARERFALYAGVRIVFACTRAVAAGVFMFSGARGLAIFSVVQLAACAAGAVTSVYLVARHTGWPSRPRRPTFRSLARGLPFSLGLASHATQDGIDKTIIVRYEMPVQAGAYAAAYRVVGFAILPVAALLRASYARFFREGASGLAGSWHLGRRMLRPAIGYGAAVALGVVLAAPLLSVLLGEAYRSSIPIVRALAFLPLVRILQYLPANALTGAGYYKLRSVCQAGTALLTTISCFLLIPPFGWIGAVVSTLLVEVIFAGAMWALLMVFLRRERSTAVQLTSERMQNVA